MVKESNSPFTLVEQLKRGLFVDKMYPLGCTIAKLHPIATQEEYIQQREAIEKLDKEIKQGLKILGDGLNSNK